MKNILLSRDLFRELVLERDNYKCCICGEEAKDVHHIMERKLFKDGGYYLNNGASLCSEHHYEAEMTIISCEVIRDKCHIETVILPDHLFPEHKYDKWGNIILPNGTRLKGELFYNEEVQKILKEGEVLDLFTKYVKYQRTYHLPWSNLKKDDRMLESDIHFQNKRVICSLKMDGENTTMYNDYLHARSLESKSHESRDWVKSLWGQKAYLIDENMRICGENLYAVHSLKYNNLGSYFKVFSIWIDNLCLSWDETLEYATILDLDVVPIIYDGIYDKDKIIEAFSKYENEHEGYVIRLADSFSYSEFRYSIGKYVRPEFKQIVDSSTGHWLSKKIEKNLL